MSGWRAFGLVAVLISAGASLFALYPGRLHYVDVPEAVLPLPQAGNRPGAEAAVSKEPGARVGGDACPKPCVAVIVTGLGLAGEATTRALSLPTPVGLSFSPYADGLAAWQARARSAGHEILLDLPLQPLRYPQDDSGPLTIPLEAPAAAQLEALKRVLATSTGHRGLVAAPGAFAVEPARFTTLASALHAQGLGLVELGGAALAVVAKAAALDYVTAIGPLDAEPTPSALDRALAALEANVLRGGRAIAYAQPTPASLERLAAWLPSLAGKGIMLVPPGTLLDDTLEGGPDQ